MGYICQNCGSEDCFKGWQRVRQDIEETVWVNGDGDTDDSEYVDTFESEVTEGPCDLRCENCESEDVDWVDDEIEIQSIKANAPNRRVGGQTVVTNWRNRLGGN